MSRRRSRRPARRAVVRWSVRLLRREWRQHVLVVALLTVAVAAALFGAATAYGVAPSHAGRFGLASHRLTVSVDDPEQLEQFVAAADSWFGGVDVITSRRLSVPGTTERLEIRSQDPAGSLGAAMLALRDGRYPVNADEVALTDGASQLLGASIGDAIELDGRQATVVGLVENPDQLDDEFVLASQSTEMTPDAAVVLIHADDDRVDDFRPDGAPQNWNIEARGQSEKTMAAIGVLIASTVAMLLVTLVAAAAFVVIAQRRQRQLGLLAAAGATEHDIRLVMVADGAGVGVIAAVAGSLLAFAAWAATVPALGRAAGRRIEVLDIPWWVVGAGAALAVATAIAAAWWPARTIAKLPIMSALSGRPPRPRRARRSAAAAIILLAAGVVSLTFAIDPSQDNGNVPLALGGVIATTFGLVLIAPPAVRLVSRTAKHAPLSPRIALRDLGRFQSRSGAAVAAISLAVAIAVTVIVIASANVHSAAEGNLSDHQLVVHLGDPGSETPLYMPALSSTEHADRADTVRRWAATLPDARIVPLDVAVDTTITEGIDGRDQHPTVVLGIPIDEDTYRDSGLMYVATPALLDYLGLDPAAVGEDTIALTSQPGDIYLMGNISDGPNRFRPVPVVERIETSPYSSVPHALITENGVKSGGWTVAPAGWLIESSDPITDAQLSSAREMAAASGMTVEPRDQQTGLSTLRSAATGVGIAAALAILAMTVGLIRAQTGGDVRTLTAVGASSRTRRGVTAATSGVLAILAVIIGTTIAYTAVIAGYTPDTDRLANVPVAQLVTVAVGFPLVATIGGWLLAGRQPRHISRRFIE
jgi:putative ABC transport system permease protein